MIINYILCSFYGLLIDDIIICTGNIAGILCGTAYFGVFCMFSTETSYWLEFIKYTLCVLLSFIIVPRFFQVPNDEYVNFIGFLGALLSFIMMASPLSTAKKVLSEKCTKSMNIVVSLAMTMSGASWVMYGLIAEEHKDLLIIVPNGLGCFAGCIQLYLFYHFSYSSTVEYDAVPESDSESTDWSFESSDERVEQEFKSVIETKVVKGLLS